MAQSARSSSESHVSSTESGSRSPYSRENYFDSIGEEYDPERETGDPNDPGEGREWGARHSFLPGVEKYEWIAHAILKGTATFLCPICLSGDDEGEHDHGEVVSELSDPELYIPKEFPEGFAPRESVQYRHRRRYCSKEGHVTFGGKIADREPEKFMAVIDMVLTGVQVHLRDDRIDELCEDARRMKATQRFDDVTILETILREIDQPSGGS